TAAVEWHVILADEGMTLHELSAAEVGAATEAGPHVLVSDTGVKHRHRDAAGAGAAGRFEVPPGPQGIDAPGGLGSEQLRPRGAEAPAGQEVPLQCGPTGAMPDRRRDGSGVV